MAEPTPTEDISDVESTSIDEQPRKYLRRTHDNSTGVTTRSRQREQDMKKKDSKSMATDSPIPTAMPPSPPTEQCAICMESFADQEVGIPENCEHSFCLNCIVHWSKKNNSCPIDRQVFRQIFKKQSFYSSKPYDSIKVQDNRLEVKLEDEFLERIDDDLTCRVCGRDDQEDLLLICDECGNGYHTFCLGLPGVPDAPDWMCPLCEVDQLSANEDLYDDSDLEELEDILFDDTLNTTGTDTELAAAARQPRVRQTARMRTGGVRNQGATSPNPRPRRRQRRRHRRRTPARRRPTLMEQQRQRQRRQRTVHNHINRRIENVNAVTRDNSTSSPSNPRNEVPRLSIYTGEAVAFDDEPTPTARPAVPANRSIITPSEAARRIAASGIPILSRSHTEPSISRELSLRRTAPSLERVPSRTIRPPTLPPTIRINQLPRIRRRADAPSRPPPPSRSTTISTPIATSSPGPSFIDNLLNSQERLHNLQNVRMHGPHIRIG